MRRPSEDDLVTIAPPEFRDIDTSPATTTATLSVTGSCEIIPFPAPPPEFRDLIPSPGDPLLTFGLSPHTLLPIQSYHHGKTFIRKSVWDFADRVSLRIVSEAVVIATVFPEAGSCTITDFRKDGSLSTDSFEDNVLSTSSSWEYLSPPTKIHQDSRVQAVDAEVVRQKYEVDPSVDGDMVIQLVVVNDESPGTSTGLGLTCHNSQPHCQLPIQCDIYSLPIDSIKVSIESQQRLPPVRFRPGIHGQPQQELKRHSLHVLERNQSDGFRRILVNNHNCVERVQSFPSMDSLERSSKGIRGNLIKKFERNNNNENLGDKMNQNSVGGHRSLPEESFGVKTETSSQNQEKKKSKGQAFLNIFRKMRQKEHKVFIHSNELLPPQIQSPESSLNVVGGLECSLTRALPTPPNSLPEMPEPAMGFRCTEARLVPGDVPSSLQEVKDCGWYWGPLASEGAEDLLRGEPDGSFIVRDSSDPRYIFSLTFKLNGLIRHVRIEHDHGNFSFGPLTRFKASTIVDFVEKAVAHSRSGRYLFFLHHRRPILGPMRVQLLHPYSRFRHPRSLQHMSRFVILKYVRRDLVDMLGLPKMLVDYLKAPSYYFEQPPNVNHSNPPRNH